MTLRDLIRVLDITIQVTICWAGDGSRICKGNLTDIPEHALSYYVTFITTSRANSLYIEVHDNKNFLEE